MNVLIAQHGEVLKLEAVMDAKGDETRHGTVLLWTIYYRDHQDEEWRRRGSWSGGQAIEVMDVFMRMFGRIQERITAEE